MQIRKKDKYLIKNTLIFTLGNLGSKVIGFLLVPLYTKALSVSGYGTLDIINVILTISIPIITFNISEAVMRFLLDEDSNKEKILQVCYFFSIVSIIFSFTLYPVFNLFPEISSYSMLLCLYIAITAISGIAVCYIRGIEKILIYAIINIIKTINIGVFSVVLLLFLHMNMEGYLISYIIAETLTILLCITFGIKEYRTKLSKPSKLLLKQMLSYSIFLIPNSLMWWVVNSMDRFMITSMFGIEANGIYAVSSKIPAMINVFTNIFNQAWIYSVVKKEDNKEEDTTYTGKIYNIFFKFINLASVFLIIILKPFLKVYVDKNFYCAWTYTVPLLIGAVFSALATFVSGEYTSHKDSEGFLRSATVGAIVNLVLNLLFMPFIGVMGAALATCASYIAVFLYRAFDIRKYKKIQYLDMTKIGYLLALFLVGISAYIDNPFLTTIVCSSAAIMFIGFCYQFLKKIYKYVHFKKK